MARVSLGTKLDCKLPEVSKSLRWKEIGKVERAAELQVSSGQCATDMVYHTFRFAESRPFGPLLWTLMDARRVVFCLGVVAEVQFMDLD